MIPENCIWLFIGDVPSAAFTKKQKAIKWIETNMLTGVLTSFPLDESCFDWAISKNALTLKPDKIKEKKSDPHFIANCLPASLEHYHFKNGKKED